jgi:hypothetical protein
MTRIVQTNKKPHIYTTFKNSTSTLPFAHGLRPVRSFQSGAKCSTFIILCQVILWSFFGHSLLHFGMSELGEARERMVKWI